MTRSMANAIANVKQTPSNLLPVCFTGRPEHAATRYVAPGGTTTPEMPVTATSPIGQRKYLDSSEFLTEDERTDRFVIETIAIAGLMADGDDVFDAVRPHIKLDYFDGINRIICKTLLMVRDQGGSLCPAFYQEMYYPPERSVEIQHILKTYEVFRDKPDRRSGSEAVADMIETIRHLHRVETALYFWHDSVGRLLYVGITEDLATRQSSHAKRSSWAAFAAGSRVRRFASRVEAERAEKAAIERHRPLFNHVHNDTPEARARLVAYLIEHGRMDLLAPAVSRG